MGDMFPNKRPKQQPVDDSEVLLVIFQRIPNVILCRFVTMDETGIHRFTPEFYRQSLERWNSPKPAESDQRRKMQLERSCRVFFGTDVA